MNKEISKIFIASDHRGVSLKLYLIEMLGASGYEIINLGTDNPNISVDYPDTARLITDAIGDDKSARGIIICGTGAGALIAANRYKNIRASRCDRPDQARDDRFHDDINVLALASDDIDIEMAFLTTESFLESPFDNIERRIRRIEQIS